MISHKTMFTHVCWPEASTLAAEVLECFVGIGVGGLVDNGMVGFVDVASRGFPDIAS